MEQTTYRRYSWQSIGAAWLAIFCFIGFGVTFVALRGPLAAEMRWSQSELSTAFAVMMASCAVSALLGGVAVDMYGARPVFAASAVLGFLGCLLGTLTTSPSAYALAFGVPAGVATGLMWVGAAVSVRDWLRGRQFGAAWGVAFLAAPIAQLFLPSLLETLGWDSGIRLFGFAVLVLMGAAAALAHKAPPREEAEADWTFRETVMSYPFWGLVIALFASVVAEFVIWAQVINFALVAFVSLFTIPLAGVGSDYLVKRFGHEAEARKAMLVLGAVFGVLACALFLLTDDRLAFTVASAVAFALYWAVEVGGAVGYAASVFGRRALGRIWGLVALLCVGVAPGVGAFFGTYMPDASWDFSTRVLYALGGFVTSALAAATLPVIAPEHRPNKTMESATAMR